jgi:multicomponent Na+:H+ antiporter subunit D
MNSSQLPVLIPITFLFGSLLVVFLGSLNRSFAHLTATAAAALALYFSIAGLFAVATSGSISYALAGWLPPLGIEFILDPLSAFFCVLLAGITLLVLIFGSRSVAYETPDKEIPFYSLTMLLLTGLTGMVMTGDLFNLYVFLEIAAVAGYALLAIGDKRAPVSAFRYLTLGTAGAAFYLLGVAFVFMSTGSLNMADIVLLLPHVENIMPVIVGMCLIVLGVCVKMGVFPIHQWLPDAYTNASSTATALIAPIGTKVAAYVLIRVFIIFEYPPILDLLSWVAALGIIAGSVLAISQTNLKRMLAYSSVANVGYITLGITLANPLAFIGAMLHIMNHALMKLVLFMVAGGIFKNMGTVDIAHLRGFPKVMPLTAVAFVIAVLSMVGIPPTGGFFSKLYLILGAIEAGAWFFVFAILLSTLLAIVYLFRVINIAFFRFYEKSDDKSLIQANDPELVTPLRATENIDKAFEAKPRREMEALMLLPTLAGALIIIVVGLYNGFIIDNFINAAIPEFLKLSR